MPLFPLNPQRQNLKRLDIKREDVLRNWQRVFAFFNRIANPCRLQVNNRRRDFHFARLAIELRKSQNGSPLVLRFLPRSQHNICSIDLQEAALRGR